MKTNPLALGLGLEIAGSNMGTQPILPLARHSFFHLDHSKGATISCVEGLLWITQKGDVEDHLIGPGQTFTIAHPGRIVVGAQKDSSLKVL